MESDDRPSSRPSSGGTADRVHSRRSVTAARGAEAVQEAGALSQRASFASALQDDGGGEDGAGSVYRDDVSAQPSRGSVQSGAHEQGETFFTALRRQYSWQSDEDAEAEDGTPPASLHSSGFFSVAGAEGDASGRLAAPADEGVAAAGASAESSCTTAAGLLEGGSQLTASVLDVIHGVYGGAPGGGAEQSRPGTAAPAVAEAPELVGAGQGTAASLHEHSPALAAEASSASDSSSATAEARDMDEEAGSGSGSAAEPELSSTSLSSIQPSEPPCADAPRQAAAGSNEAAAALEPAEDSAALLARVDGLLDARSKVQAELGGYLQQLSRQEDSEGQLLQERLDSEAYGVLVERLLAEGRAQSYRALQGWKGPHRFEDLPIATLSAAAAGADARVVAGLAAIAKLDEELREASLKALVAARASNPQHWADAEKRRLERRAGELDAALAAERARRLHAAKLRRTLVRLDGEGGGGAGDLTDAPGRGRLTSCYSYYRLAPHEEQLLAAVMARDDAALEADDPFDPMLLCPGDNDDAADAGGLLSAGGKAGSVCSGSTADAAHTAGGSSFSSCLGSSLFHLMRRPSTAGSHSSSGVLQGRRLSLADIDAQLAVIQAKRAVMEQQAAEQEGKPRPTGLSRSSSISKKGSCSGLSAQSSISASGPSRIPSGLSSQGGAAAGRSGTSSSTSNGPSRIPSGVSSAAAAAAAARRPNSQPESGGRPSGSHHTSRRESSASTGASAPEGSVSSAGRSTGSVATDHLREQREARRLQQRQAELDAQLRALQKSALPDRLAQEQLQALLQCAY